MFVIGGVYGCVCLGGRGGGVGGGGNACELEWTAQCRGSAASAQAAAALRTSALSTSAVPMRWPLTLITSSTRPFKDKKGGSVAHCSRPLA